VKAKGVDQLNLLLIPICGILAYQFPLELFILSYTILGPLHYLTEINWLSSKEYFTKKLGNRWLIMSVIGVSVVVLPKLYFYTFGVTDSAFTKAVLYLNNTSNSVIFSLLIMAVLLVFVKQKRWVYIGGILSLLLGVFINANQVYTDLVGLFIPTIIHVYLFTLLFMYYGARKSKSKYGYLSVIAAIVLPILIVYVKVNPQAYSFAQYFKDLFIDNSFHVMPVIFSKYAGLSDGTTFFFYEVLEIKLMMFVSFIYLYHYLNWFSKTSLIEWHKALSKKKYMVIIPVWIILLIISYFNFRLGFLLSLGLSFLHVFTEFPLNIISLKGVFSKGS
jgi:hypothetical protein